MNIAMNGVGPALNLARVEFRYIQTRSKFQIVGKHCLVCVFAAHSLSKPA